jgi:hypothetical protein
MERTATDSISAEEVYEVLVMDETFPIQKIKLQNKIESFKSIS